MEPILIDVPERIETERLVLRVPRAGDGRSSTTRSAPRTPSSRRGCRGPGRCRASTSRRRTAVASRRASSCARTSSSSSSFATPSGGEGELVGGTGLHRIDWTLRKFEIGYWRKTGCEGRGFVTEAVRALARLAFDTLDARRVEIRMDDNNARAGASPSAPASRSRRCCASTPRRRGRPAQHAGLCARARRRGADGAGLARGRRRPAEGERE